MNLFYLMAFFFSLSRGKNCGIVNKKITKKCVLSCTSSGFICELKKKKIINCELALEQILSILLNLRIPVIKTILILA